MANETDKLKEFLVWHAKSELFGIETVNDIRHWLQELLTARGHIPAMRESLAFYRSRNEQLTGENIQLLAENRQLKADMAVETAISRKGAERIAELEDSEQRLQYQRSCLLAKVEALDGLLCWITAAIEQYRHLDYSYQSWSTAWDALENSRQLLATQGYTRELIESRGEGNG